KPWRLVRGRPAARPTGGRGVGAQAAAAGHLGRLAADRRRLDGVERRADLDFAAAAGGRGGELAGVQHAAHPDAIAADGAPERYDPGDPGRDRGPGPARGPVIAPNPRVGVEKRPTLHLWSRVPAPHEIVLDVDTNVEYPVQCGISGVRRAGKTLNHCLSVGRKKARKTSQTG